MTASNMTTFESQHHATSYLDGVTFDADNVILRGIYSDEISAFRARKMWIETFESSFLLELNHDYKLRVKIDENGKYTLICEFFTACARYAFWRITNNQAPEAQYIIETAHIPVCDSRQNEILHAPDLRCTNAMPTRERKGTSLPDILKNLVEKIRGEKSEN